ncbi:MAG: phosphoribosyltransferase [Candidatus Bipolaricaulia bacterium]
MGLKHTLRESFAQLRTSIRSVLQRILLPLPLSSNDLALSGPQPLRGPWEEGWALDIHSRRVGSSFQLTEMGWLVLMILDDLYDSGETLREVTRVLKRAGARSIKVVTLTRTRHAHP